MKIKTSTYFASIVFAVIANGIAFNADADTVVTTFNVPTCKSWIEDVKTEKDRRNMQWISGFVSGAAAMWSIKNDFNILKNENIESVYARADKFCKENQNTLLSEAASQYLLELIEKKSPQKNDR